MIKLSLMELLSASLSLLILHPTRATKSWLLLNLIAVMDINQRMLVCF